LLSFSYSSTRKNGVEKMAKVIARHIENDRSASVTRFESGRIVLTLVKSGWSDPKDYDCESVSEAKCSAYMFVHTGKFAVPKLSH
jgi:hypothetical protein